MQSIEIIARNFHGWKPPKSQSVFKEQRIVVLHDRALAYVVEVELAQLPQPLLLAVQLGSRLLLQLRRDVLGRLLSVTPLGKRFGLVVHLGDYCACHVRLLLDGVHEVAAGLLQTIVLQLLALVLAHSFEHLQPLLLLGLAFALFTDPREFIHAVYYAVVHATEIVEDALMLLLSLLLHAVDQLHRLHSGIMVVRYPNELLDFVLADAACWLFNFPHLVYLLVEVVQLVFQ